jgi:hypothetical protein
MVFLFFVSFIKFSHVFKKTIKGETDDMMSPLRAYMDFEEALAEALQKVFPNATICRDFFHFIQANIKQAGKLGLKSLAKEIRTDCNILWYAPTKKEFDSRVQEFLQKWDNCEPTYSEYFRKNWLGRFKIEQWASFGRPSDALAGIFFFFGC